MVATQSAFGGGREFAKATDFVFERSGGYPYFIQEWGFQLWDFVQEEPITLKDAQCVDESVNEKLDRHAG